MDILRYNRDLKEAGFNEKQAELIINGQVEVINQNFVSKSEFHAAMKEIDHKFELVDQKFERLENRLVMKLGSLMVIGFGVMGTMIKLI